jgi:hypothetical protein
MGALNTELMKGGFAAPVNWYKVQTSGLAAADDASACTAQSVLYIAYSDDPGRNISLLLQC